MKKFFTFALTAIIFSSLAWAIPAKRTKNKIVQTDGTELTVIKRGDEFFHYYTTLDGLVLQKKHKNAYYYATIENGKLQATTQLAHNPNSRKNKEKELIKKINWVTNTSKINTLRKSKSMKRHAQMRKTAAITKGNMRVLVLLVEYSDLEFSKTDAEIKTYMSNQLNQAGNTNGGAHGSAKEYFEAQSFNQFSPQFDVVGPIQLDNTREYYGGNDVNGNDQRPAKMISDACNKIRATVNFSDYDSNNDGLVDIVYCIYAGEGEASGGPDESIWPHQWNINYGGETFQDDGVSVQKYACSNELMNNNITGNGTICHEFSHSLGLPDFYDTDQNGNEGMGYWDLMDSGSYLGNGYTPPCWSAHERAFVGWLTPTIITNETQITNLKPIDEGGKAYQLINPSNSDEYYIIDNRQKRGFDKGLIGHGLMVMHLDYDASSWANNSPNNTVGHERCYILCADGNRSFNSTNEIINDLFPSALNTTSITSTTNPKMELYTGGTLEMNLTNILENNDGFISFNFTLPLDAPTALPATNVTENSFTANWSEVEGANSYSIEMNEITSEEQETNVFNESFDDITIALASKDLSYIINNYMIRKGWSGEKLFGGDKKLRLGSSSTRGLLKSPTFNCTTNQITVALTAKAYNPTDNSSLVIGLSSENNSSLLDYKSTSLTENDINYYTVLNNAQDNAFIEIYTDYSGVKPRAYIDNVKVMQGDQSSFFKTRGYSLLKNKKNASLIKTKKESSSLTNMVSMMKNVYNNIAETSYTFANLTAGKTYKYRVKAIADNNESVYSNYVTIITANGQGLDNVSANPTLIIQGNQILFTLKKSALIKVYNFSGQCIIEELGGKGENNITLRKGLYLIQIENKTYKIVITQ